MASFELGTDPDINTVNVNNRVQVALSKLPDEVRQPGVRVKKKSSALLGVIAVYSPKETHDELFISNYVTINLLDQIKSTPGVGDASLFGPQDYSMRVWVQTDRLTGLGLTDSRHHQGDPVAERAGGGGPHRRAADLEDQQLQLNIQTKGRLGSVAEFENIIIRTNPGRFNPATRRYRATGTRGRQSRSFDTPERRAVEPDRHLSVARCQCADHAGRVKKANDRRRAKRFPDDVAWKITYDPTTFVTATIHEVVRSTRSWKRSSLSCSSSSCSSATFAPR